MLDSLIDQTIPTERFEIIVVDDGSKDETSLVCKQYQCKFPNMIYRYLNDNVGIGRARNVGVIASTSDFLLFTDDDCIPARNWIERTCEALKIHSIVAGAVDGPMSPYLCLCHNVAEFHALMPGKKQGITSFIAGANMGIRREVLCDLHGFSESLRIAEDMELILRAYRQGYVVYFLPESLVMHHHDRKCFSQIVDYSVQHARSTILLRNTYRRLMRTPYILRSRRLLLLSAPLIAMVTTCAIFFRNPRMARYIHTTPVIFCLKIAWCWGAAQGLKDFRLKLPEG